MRKTFAMAAIAAAFTIGPVTTALATTPPHEANDVGAIDTPAAENQVGTWCEQGVKYDNLDGQTFTIPAPPDGFTWTKLILNGGQDGAPEGNVRSYIVEPVPAVGTVVTRPGAAVSNAILCYEPTAVQETATTTAPTLTPTPEDDVSAAGPVPPAASAWPTGDSPTGAASPTGVSPAGASPATASQALPTTGSSSWGMALAALAAMVGGLGLVQLSRRTI